VVEREPDVAFELVGVVLAEEFLVNPLVEVEQLLANVGHLLTQQAVLPDQLAHLPLVALEQEGVLGLVLLEGFLLVGRQRLEHLE